MITNLTVQPHWAKNQLTLHWQTAGEPAPDCRVMVLSSLDSKSWVNVTAQGFLDTTTKVFIHQKPLSNRPSQELYYKVVIQTNDQRWDSPSVNALTLLKPHEFGIVRQILASELLNMQVGEGVKVQLLKPLTFGEYADSYDPESGQQLAANTDLSGYGQKYRHGFFPPFETWLALSQQQDLEDVQKEGTLKVTTITARAFCFPRPVKQDLIINTATDERYTVGEVRTHRFKGIIPVMCDIELNLLARGDIRYKINPNELPDPYTL